MGSDPLIVEDSCRLLNGIDNGSSPASVTWALLHMLSASSLEAGLLPPVGAQPHEPFRHHPRLLHRDLFPGLQGGPAREVPEGSWSAGIVSDQAVLHLEHPHHPADGLGLQPLLLLAAPLPPLQVQHAREPPRAVAGD